MRLLYCYVHFPDEEGIPAPFRGLEKLEFNFSTVDRFSYDIETNTLTRKDRTCRLPKNFWSDDLSQKTKTNIYNVNVISGQNGSGKTTAIHYLSDLLDSIHAAADPTVKDRDRMVKRGVAGNRTLLLLEEAGEWFLIDYVPLIMDRGKALQTEGLSEEKLYIFHIKSWQDFSDNTEQVNEALSALLRAKVIFLTNALSQHDYERNQGERNNRLRDCFVYDASIGSTVGPDIAKFFPYEVYKQVCFVFGRKQLVDIEKFPELVLPNSLRLQLRLELMEKFFPKVDSYRRVGDNSNLALQLGKLCVAAFIQNLRRFTNFNSHLVCEKDYNTHEDGDLSIKKLMDSIIDAEKQFERSLRFQVVEGHTDKVNCLAILPRNRLASGSNDKTIRIWDVDTGRCLRTLSEHKERINCIAVLPNGHIVSGSSDKTLRIWDTETGKCLKTLSEHDGGIYSLAILPHGQVVSGSGDKTVRVWDTSTGKCLKILRGHTGRVSCLAVLNENHVISGSWDHSIRVWDIAAEECLQTLNGHGGKVNCVDLLPDGSLVSGASDGTLRVWDPNTGRCIRPLGKHCGKVNFVSVLPSGYVASGANDMILCIWDAKTGKCLHRMRGHNNRLTCLTFITDRYIVSGSDDKTVQAWDIVTGQHWRIWTGHRSGVTCVTFLPNGHIVSTDRDGIISISNDIKIDVTLALKDSCLDYLSFLSNKSQHLFSRFTKIDERTYELTLNGLEMVQSLEKSKKDNDVRSREQSRALYRDLIDFIQKYIQTCKPTYTIDFDWGMSSGEENMLRLFSNLYHVFDPNDRNGDGFIYNNESHSEDERQRTKCDSVLLFLDEADLTLHPEWQRRLILILTAFLPQLFPPKCVKDMQVILSTHSPLLLGDIPGENITYLPAKKRTDANKNEKNGEGNTEHWETFGENIHTILKESFFLSNGTVGAFAARRINYIAQRLNWIRLQAIDTTNSEWRQSLKEELQTLKQGIDIVAPGVLRARLEQLYRIAEAALRPREETEIDMDKLLATVKRLPPEARQQLITLLNKGV